MRLKWVRRFLNAAEAGIGQLRLFIADLEAPSSPCYLSRELVEDINIMDSTFS